MTRQRHNLTMLIAAVALALAACGASTDEASDAAGDVEASTSQSTTEPAPSTTETAAATVTTATSTEDAGSDDGADADQPIEIVGGGGSITGAGLTFTAEQCAFPEGSPVGSNPADHFAAVAVVADTVYLTGQDGEADTGLLAYRQAAEPNCSLLIDTGFGAGGVLDLGDPIDHVSAAQDGTIAASNSIFGTWSVDGSTGTVVECGRGSFVEISPTGTVGYGHFPGSGDLHRYTFGPGSCSVESSALTVAAQGNPTGSAWIDDGLFVIGGFLPDGGAGVTALDAAGNELWTVGGSPGDVGDVGYGTVSAVAPCRDLVCVVDSNFRRLHVLQPADGAQLGTVDLQALTSSSVLWFNGLTVDPGDPTGNTLWLVGGHTQPLADGSSSERIQGLVYRVLVEPVG